MTRPGTSLLRALAILFAAWPAFGWVARGQPVASVTRRFDLGSGDAATTLKTFAEQSGAQIVYLVDQVRGVRTNAVSGVLAPRAALARMLAGTPLQFEQDEQTGALAIARILVAPPVATRPAPPPAPPRPPPLAPASADGLIQLSPFEVRTAPDNSYGALDSNSLTSFRIDRDKMPATSTVFTQTFMDDVAATSIQDLLVNYTGTVGADPNNSGAALAMPGDRDGSGGGLGIRGLSASPPKRDGFLGPRSLYRSPIGYTDNFSTERVEVIEGPQSLLYGAVGGGGVVNIVSKRAYFGLQRGSLQTRVDQYGSKRALLDLNAATDRFALRIAAAGDTRRNVRYNLGNEFYGLFAQAAVRLAPRVTLRIFGERDSNWGNVPFTPGASDLNNFLPAGDPRRGQDVRYLALTGQLADLRGSLWNGPVDYAHISSFGAWWSSERIDGRLAGATLDAPLGRGFSAQVGLIYSETTDDRFTVSKNLVPAAGLPGSGANPFPGTAVRLTPADNWQSDRTKGARATLLHEVEFHLGRWKARAQTALGFEGSHQGPAFASSGIDRFYYQADANWNPILSPGVTTDYGRVALGNLYFPVQNGIPLRPIFRPGARRITLDGRNYVLEPRIRQDASFVTPQNPFGLVPNNPTPGNPNGFSGQWNRGGETHDRQWYLANYTEWDDGKVTTVAGLSVDRFETLNTGPGIAPTYLAPRNYPGFQAGATYRLDSLPGWRVYGAVGTAGLAAGTTKDFYGNNLRVPHTAAAWPEVGVKYNAPDGRFAAQFAWNPLTKVVGEAQRTGTDFFNAVNPNGINGRYNSGDQWINLNRKAAALEFVATANPSPNWRIRASATHLDGEITSTVSYRQLYNDQFYTRGGVVTYRDATPVLVDAAGANGAATTPLTLALLNDPASPFYAAPDPDSGRITNPLLITALTAVDPQHGAAGTGVTGLPLSAIQYTFANPHRGEITVVSAGDKTTGINEFSFNLQNNYTFASGPLRGVSVFADVRSYWRNRAYYTSYFPAGAAGNGLQATRALYRLPTATVAGLGVGYRRRLPGQLDRFTWSTRLNIDNLFNHSRVWVLPSPANGANLNARLSAQPRVLLWTNTIGF
jgi:outer membrane receptor protein involved in Fe transport